MSAVIVDPRLVTAVDALVVAAVGITTRTLADSPLRDITLGQWRILALLRSADRGRRLGVIAAAAGMSPPSASRMVGRLVNRGYVASRPEPEDGRAVRLELTEFGRRLVDDVLDRRRDVITESLCGRSFSAAFRAEFDRLAAALTEAAGGRS